MKNIKILFLSLLAILSFSCNDLDIKSIDIIQDPDILNSEIGVTAYLSGIYRKMPMEDFYYWHERGFQWNRDWPHFMQSGAVVGELWLSNWGGCSAMEGFRYWPYDDIRNINYFLERFPDYSNYFSEGKYNGFLGEAYFLRAYFYFALVKRYGGIPIEEYVKNPLDKPEVLQVPRNTELEVWNFIKSDLDKAYQLLPEKSMRAQANRYVAAALKSRAMLYAGTIAKYGSVNFVAGEAREKGYVGIPASEANGFFQAAYDAASEVITKGSYSLYNLSPDKVKNYCDLFLDKSSSENIFVRDYSISAGTSHSWDATTVPKYMYSNGGTGAYPTLNFVRLFGELPVINPDGTPRRFNQLNEILEGLEPRLRAIIYFPGEMLRENLFDTQRGIYEKFIGTAAAETDENTPIKPNQAWKHTSGSHDAMYPEDPNAPNRRLIIGMAGSSQGVGSETQTGMYRRKYVDYTRPQSDFDFFRSTTAFIDFRLAEVMLNRAEAGFELGDQEKVNEAINDINAIRERAGAEELPVITLEEIRKERRRELAFENHLYWDLRRWRTADKELDQTKIYSLMPYYVYDEGKYIFLQERDPDKKTFTYEVKWYYEPIPGEELSKNPNLYPNNPGY